MGLNIKNERVHELARRAARTTGKSQTGVIEEALERLLADLDRQDRDQARQMRLDVIFADIDATITDADRQAVRGAQDQLYDDRGLPA